MKTNIPSCLLATLLSVVFTAKLSAQSTAFTYQGELRDNGQPANGVVDLQFALFDQDSEQLVAGPITLEDQTVTNGLFTVLLNFGSGPFDGSILTLELRVREGASSGAFETIAPRQVLTSSPYAFRAFSAGSLAATGPIDLTIAGIRALRLEPAGGKPNVIGGHLSNFVASASGAFIGGGGTQNEPNVIRADFGVIGGGIENQVTGAGGVIGGGQANLAGADAAFIGGGGGNQATARFAVVTGGWLNLAGATNATVSGGSENQIHPDSTGAVVGGGARNLVHTNSGYAVIGGGFLNQIEVDASHATISGGEQNLITDSGAFGTIAGGFSNRVQTLGSVAGGEQNTASFWATVGGGYANRALGQGSVVGGGGSRLVFLGSASATVGPPGSTTHAAFSVIGGGSGNLINSNSAWAMIGGGQLNEIENDSARTTISGGGSNRIESQAEGATIGGGSHNQVTVRYGAIGGGGGDSPLDGNLVSDEGGFVGGGGRNHAGNTNGIATDAYYATVTGGWENRAGGKYAVVPGGLQNRALADLSFAAGRRATANNPGSFVWGDSQDADITSATDDDVTFRCGGGVRFLSGSGGANQQVAWAPGGGSWAFSSDRNLKEDFREVDTGEVLEKVARLPITEWKYKGYAQRHIGPAAQDFHAQFPLNGNDTTLNDADLHGVALAAIQGLNRKLEERLQQKDAKIARLEREMAELRSLVRRALDNSLPPDLDR